MFYPIINRQNKLEKNRTTADDAEDEDNAGDAVSFTLLLSKYVQNKVIN